MGNKKVELRVSYTLTGEPVNQYDEDSVNHSEDVIVLSGKYTADGIVTYSTNGDGTINLYDAPSHWPGHNQIDEPMEDYTQDIIDNTELLEIESGIDEDIIDLVKKVEKQI